MDGVQQLEQFYPNDLVGSYRLISELGGGTFGIVWKAQQENDPSVLVAIKIPTNNATSESIQKEITVMKKLLEPPSIPRIPKFIEEINHKGLTLIVMDFVPGQPPVDPKTKLPINPLINEADASYFLWNCLDTLKKIHKRGIIHRDIKPENVIIHEDTGDPWIIDFGIAKQLRRTQTGGHTATIGSFGYQAPETSLGKLGEFSDIYSLGAMIVSLTGTLQDDACWHEPIPRCKFSDFFSSILIKMVQLKSKNRYQDCQEILQEFEVKTGFNPLTSIYRLFGSDQEDPVTQCNSGVRFHNGDGVVKNEKLAVKYYQLSADQGYAMAQCNLGWCYEKGFGVVKNEKLAVKYYQLSADQGNAMAQNNLGWIFQNGIGVVKNEQLAINYYQLSVDQGNPRAQCNLGLCYEKGIGVMKNEQLAIKYYQLSSDQGNARAQCNLGLCYEKGIGVMKNEQLALELCQLAEARAEDDDTRVEAQEVIARLKKL